MENLPPKSWKVDSKGHWTTLGQIMQLFYVTFWDMEYNLNEENDGNHRMKRGCIRSWSQALKIIEMDATPLLAARFALAFIPVALHAPGVASGPALVYARCSPESRCLTGPPINKACCLWLDVSWVSLSGQEPHNILVEWRHTNVYNANTHGHII